MQTDTPERLHSLAIRLLRFARVVDARSGMSAPRLSVLSVLVFGGARTVTELATAEQVATPTMTRLLNSLEAEGYVRRVRDRADARVVRVHATARGRRVLEAGRAARVERVASLLAGLDAADRARIDETVDLLSRTLTQTIEAERVG